MSEVLTEIAKIDSSFDKVCTFMLEIKGQMIFLEYRDKMCSY